MKSRMENLMSSFQISTQQTATLGNELSRISSQLGNFARQLENISVSQGLSSASIFSIKTKISRHAQSIKQEGTSCTKLSQSLLASGRWYEKAEEEILFSCVGATITETNQKSSVFEFLETLSTSPNKLQTEKVIDIFLSGLGIVGASAVVAKKAIEKIINEKNTSGTTNETFLEKVKNKLCDIIKASADNARQDEENSCPVRPPEAINSQPESVDYVSRLMEVVKNEKDEALKDNKKGQVDRKNKYNGETNSDWCAYFVVWCMKEADLPKINNPKNYNLATVTGLRKALVESNGATYFPFEKGFEPQPGDIIVYYNDDGPDAHVGIVTNYDGTKDPRQRVTTIEGNTTVDLGNGIKGKGIKQNDRSIENPVYDYLDKETGKTYKWRIQGYIRPNYNPNSAN